MPDRPSLQAETIGHQIKRLQHRHHRAIDAALAPLGLSLVQWNALREIDRLPGATMHRLAESSFNSDQAFGTLAARLIRLGLIARGEGQGRALTHQLTQAGQSALAAGQPAASAVVAGSLSRLTAAEMALLQALLFKALGDAPAS